jgi:hypothetical protein
MQRKLTRAGISNYDAANTLAKASQPLTPGLRSVM